MSKVEPIDTRGALPPITLAIPFYSRFDFLRSTISSVAWQTHADCRLIVIDDSPQGLTEDEREQIGGILQGRMPLSIVRTEGAQGMASTWGRCLSEATTDLVTIVHGDDELEPRYAEAVATLAAKHPQAHAVFSGARIIGEDGRRAWSFPDWYKGLLVPQHATELLLQGDAGLASILRGNYIFCPSVCYRRSLLPERRFDAQYKFVLDIEFISRLLLSGATLVGIPRQPLYRYRRHENNATAQLTRELTRFREESGLYSLVAERSQQAGFVRSSKVARAARIIRLNLAYCTLRDLASLQLGPGTDKLRLLMQLQRSATRAIKI